MCLLQYDLVRNSTLSLLQRVCSSRTVSVKGKAVFHQSARLITAEPLRLSIRLKVQFDFRPLDGPFNQEILPPPLFRHYRHHCPQNGWQLLEIPGCVTTLRCTCCAIYVPPVLMPQQPERQRRIIPATAQVPNYCCRLILDQSYRANNLTITSFALEIWNNYLWVFCHVINFQKTTEDHKGSIFTLYSCWCTLLFCSNKWQFHCCLGFWE